MPYPCFSKNYELFIYFNLKDHSILGIPNCIFPHLMLLFSMLKYLLFYLNGFVKKFPLNRPDISIGRSVDCDLTIDKSFISREHAQISLNRTSAKSTAIIIKDLNSTNGIHVGNSRVKEAVISVGESFNLGRMEFYLKEGDLDEFKPAPELISIFNQLNRENKKKYESTETTNLTEIYNDILKEMLHVGLKTDDFNEFVQYLSTHLSQLADFGGLFLVTKQGDSFNITFSISSMDDLLKPLILLVRETPAIYSKVIKHAPVPGSPSFYYAYPVEDGEGEISLIYLTHPNQEVELPLLEHFLLSLSHLIELFRHLHSGKNRISEEKHKPPVTDMEIIGSGKKMQDLLEQTRKIAAGDIFVLIQGESGTGKELFARFIHQHSKRWTKPFIALNCAAIPDHLLESEFFGYEKGAFTGAYSQKKGKLELASGGVLVLDEVGDMPIHLQSKLLRAVQEHEFYRLGGTTPIKVQLRIISLTNRNLKHLVKTGEFREDLYYRLVHRSITIPPLRERKEDIPALVNFFTNKFCKLTGKTINGYSVKAFEFLLNHDWKGNIRQLENELKSIVDLTDDGEMITYDILSDEIKGIDYDQAQHTQELRKMDEEEQKAHILSLLEKNAWNKSETARELNMTYRGLHKKLTKWGIKRPSR
jgi:Nif-specific regulatory protein